MVQAMDSARSMKTRRVLLVLFLAEGLAQTGCSQMRSFRKEAPPAFGTEASEHGPKSEDSYAERLAPRVKASRAALAKADRSQTDGSVAVVASAKESGGAGDGTTSSRMTGRPPKEPAVALQSPVAIPSMLSPDGTKVVSGSIPALPESDTKANQETISESVTVGSSTIIAAPIPDLTTVLGESRKAIDSLSTYQIKMTHQQRIGRLLQEPEAVVMSIRRQPKAVRLEWPEGTSKGREVLYAADIDGGQMHVKMPNPLLPRLSMAPDGPLATRSSRHPISEAGFDTIIAGMEAAQRAALADDPSFGRLSYEGLETPEGIDSVCEKIVRVSPEQERWVVYLDPKTHLPRMFQANSANGDLLERHVFQEIRTNVPELASREAFDPDSRWGPNKGFLQRLARTPTGPDSSTQTR